MSVHNLERVFHPKSVAVIGASEREGSVGSALMRNLTGWEYPGDVYPINPHRKTIHGIPTVPSVLDLDSEVDLAVLATPIATAPELVKESARARVGGVIIVSAGGKEAGSQGRELESRIKREADRVGLRVIGPNCLGIISGTSRLNATFANKTPLPGKMAFLSQSGAICTAILDLSIKERIGFSYFVSIGSMIDVDFGDLIDYLGGEPDVSSIVMYVESLTNFRKFMSAARAVSRIKPVIVLKSGRTGAGARAAASHTGALAGEDAVYDAAFKRAGIVRVKTFEELFDCEELLAKQPRPTGSGLAIITNAGGPGVMAADALADYGVEPVILSPETIRKLDETLPPYWSHDNPIDILGDASPERYRKVVQVCLDASEVNGLLIMLTPQMMTDPTGVARALTAVLQAKAYPVFTCWLGGEEVERGRDTLNRAGIPTFDSPERAVRAFVDLYHYTVNLQMLQEIPPKLPRRIEVDLETAKEITRDGLWRGNTVLTEPESKALLSAYGIPVNRTETATCIDEAVRKARELGFPLAMKIHSPDILHKTEANGVHLDLRNEEDVRSGFERVIAGARAYKPEARIEGVTIEPMLQHPDVELILGTKRDRDFGPVILFGFGGIMTEVIKDQAIALPPLNRLLARRLMEGTKIYRMLRGYRNRPAADLVLLEEILIRLAQLVTDFSEIDELDINPLVLTKHGAIALDARVILSPTQVPAPFHLVISSYPNHHETHTVTEGGVPCFIRPIRPEDAPLLEELFDSLSPQSVYFRFFTPLKALPHSMLARFTQIDYDREIALIALRESACQEQMLGVARAICIPGRNRAELSIVVGDHWQGKGIGAALLKRCIAVAKEHGIQELEGIVLPENTRMLALGRKLGFSVTRGLHSCDYELKIDLRKLQRSRPSNSRY
jgi:acetyltransferase